MNEICKAEGDSGEGYLPADGHSGTIERVWVFQGGLPRASFFTLCSGRGRTIAERHPARLEVAAIGT